MRSDVDSSTIGDSKARNKQTQLEKNKAQGKEGERKVAKELGDSKKGEQITVETLDGDRARIDFVAEKDGKTTLVEVKTGNAKLSKGQEAVKKAIEDGQPIIPRGKNAEKADLEPGKPIICSFEEKRC